MSKRLKTLKSKVFYCLERFPRTRNSDIELTIQIWKTFYSERLYPSRDGTTYLVDVRDLFDIPREDNIKRIRAKIQNEENLFLPTVLEVALKRNIEEEVWRNFMGYPPKEESTFKEFQGQGCLNI